MPCLSKVQVKLTDYEAALEAALEVFGEKNVYTLTDKWLGDDIYIAAVINGKRESIYLSRRKVKGAFEKNLYTSAKTAGEMQIVAKVSQVYAETKIRQFAKAKGYGVQVITPAGSPDVKLRLRATR